MATYRFYVPDADIKGNTARLSIDEEHHALNVLRLKAGDKAYLFNGSGKIYEAAATSIKPLRFKIIKTSEFKPTKKLNIYVGLAKSKKLDKVIRQLTEVGVCEIVIFSSRRSIPALTAEKAEKKLDRWNKIAVEATKQSRREAVPSIKFMSWEQLIQNISLPIIVMYEEGGDPINKCLDKIKDSATAMVGPEGGFSPGEIKELVGKGAEICCLGRYILRVETAAVYAASVFASRMELAIDKGEICSR